MTKHLFIGGLVAAGFDPDGKYLLDVSHSGRGLFDTRTWECVARERELSYPACGYAGGIGPIATIAVPVREIDGETGLLHFITADAKFSVWYEEGTLTVATKDEPAQSLGR